ncbi:MAG: helix-turn-helix domain-containing protein [Patescibacteria group bacterium]
MRPEDLTGIGRLAGSSTPQKAAADIKQIDEDNAEKRLIGQVLLRHKGDISAAAASLNITRGDLDRKMEMLKIKVEK